MAGKSRVELVITSTVFTLLLFLLNIVSLATAQSCSHDNVRLTNGTVPYEGRLEICYRGTYVTACYRYWDDLYGYYICMNLGCGLRIPEYYPLAAGQDIPYYVGCYSGYIPFHCYFDSICDNTSAAVGIRCHPQVPGVPSNVIFSDIQSASFVLSWSFPSITQCRYIDNYVVNCSSHTDQPYHTAVESSSLSLTVTGLLPFTTYDCCVAANNSAAEGNQTCSTVRTEPVPPDPPQTIVVIYITSTSALLGWTQPLNAYGYGPLTGYIINCSHTQVLISLSPDETTAWLRALSPNTHHLCCVSATNMVGSGEVKCASFQTEPAPPSAPGHLTVSSMTTFSVVFSWAPPTMLHGLTVEYYTLNCSNQSSSFLFDFTNDDSDSLDNVSASIQGLIPQTAYTCCVSAITEAGEGEEACILVMTQEPQGTMAVSTTLALVAGVSSFIIVLLLVTSIAIVVLVLFAKKRLKKSDDNKNKQPHIYEEMDTHELQGDPKAQMSTNTVRYKTTQLHTSDTTTDITPQLPSREYLEDENFMKELTSSNDRATEGKGIAELEPENKVYQPLIPPRLHELEEGGSNTDYQPLTYAEKTNDETTNENTVYEPVTFTAEQ